MLIDDAINELQRLREAGETSVLAAWWTADDFQTNDYWDWDEATEYAEWRMDWSNVHAELCDLLSLSEEVRHEVPGS